LVGREGGKSHDRTRKLGEMVLGKLRPGMSFLSGGNRLLMGGGGVVRSIRMDGGQNNEISTHRGDQNILRRGSSAVLRHLRIQVFIKKKGLGRKTCRISIPERKTGENQNSPFAHKRVGPKKSN